MSKIDKKTRGALVVRPSYKVGYGKPPKDTRFKPGQSGNPGGRPKGSKNKRPGMHEERLKEIILDEAYRTIPVREGSRTASIPMAQAVVRAMAVNAAKGQHRAQRLFAELLASTESSRRLLHDEFFSRALDYKLAWDRELQRREALGITDLPEPIPHPDHVEIDPREGRVRIIGPMTKDEQEKLDWLKAQRQECELELAEYHQEMETTTDEELRERLLNLIRLNEDFLNRFAELSEKPGWQ